MPGVLTMPRNSKINHGGIEVANKLTWERWRPGQEYTKNIVLKNVKVKTQKLKYKGPASRFFATLYPQPIVLSAGTSFTLPVTFRPIEETLYQDKIVFHANGDEFSVPIEAVLPEVVIEVPESITFNMCAAHDVVQLSFDVRNAGELLTLFQISCDAPFHIYPTEGVLEPYATTSITATFKPQAALAYEAQATVKYGPEYSHEKHINLEGIGKYPHLVAVGSKSALDRKEVEVSFGVVSITKTLDHYVELRNLSAVNAPFTVEHPSGLSRIDTVFECPQRSGVVPALSAMRLPITFSPNMVGVKSIDYFHIKPIGNMSKTVVKCCGSSKGPRVELSRTIINFMQLDSGRSGTKTVDIINKSDREASFQFFIDCNESVFKLEYVSGTLPANSKKTIILKFQPVHPINYYRRVTCLVHNQEPLYLDLLGTCHTETQKPAVLQSKHISRYEVHRERGFTFTPPEQLNEMIKNAKLTSDEEGFLCQEGQESIKPAVHSTHLDEYFNDGYFSEVTHHPPHISLDLHEADFGQCIASRNLEQKIVNVTNHTKGKVTVVWNGDRSHVFSVSPQTMDIPPLKSCSFRITFNPAAPNQFYGSQLEGFAYYKSLRDYRLVEETTHCPPWCLTLTAIGHTFLRNNETFLPKFFLDSNKLVFPAVNTNESTYRTLLFSNTGTTPIQYDFEKDFTGVYSVKPSKGLLAVQENQIFVIKMLPTKVNTYKHVLKLRLNDADKNTQEILACGSAEAPEVLLEDGGVLYFKPTCIKTLSQRQFAVKNMCRTPLMFEWKFHHADRQVLSVEPPSGVIQPNENQYHTWTFRPNEGNKYVMKPALIAWGQGQGSKSSCGKKKQFTLRAVGEGTDGDISVEQSYLDFSTIVIGSSASKSITLMNESDCSLQYQLAVTQNISGPYSQDEMNEDPLALELEKMGGVLPARSRVNILVTARPARRVYYQWSISYQLLDPEGQSFTYDSRHLCHVLCTGVYPTMAVTDARCSGSALGLSKKQLWSLFALDNLNSCLDCDPSAAELMYNVATRHSHRRRIPVYTRAIQDFNFSAAPLGSEACVVQLLFENTGAVTCHWSFLFPCDLQLELDYWAETGDFDADELHEMKVMDNKLFSVEPKQGKLDPGECATVVFTYKHTMAGTDRLPVLLKLARGREILMLKDLSGLWLNFVGVTVDPDRRYVHFPNSKFLFAPAPIGEKSSAKQIYELYNGGALPVKYEFDTRRLVMLQQENYDQPIFECFNPMGEILPGNTASIEWRFSPLEAKTYMVDVPIFIHNGDTAVVTFTGVGFDKRHLADTMPITDKLDFSGVPSVQSVATPGQLCYLSQERISFGNMPLFSKARRLVAIANKSTEHAVTFTWHVTTKLYKHVVSISPSHGRLQAGEARECKVTFTALGVPSFYDIDLICELNNETEDEQYRNKLRAWEDEMKRQQVEFTITEEDLEQEKSATRGRDPERTPSGRLKALDTIRTPSPESEFAKYKTLPPIKMRSVDKARAEARNKRKHDKQMWSKPEPSKPSLLHLGVTARTHGVVQFQQNFPDIYTDFYIDRCLSKSQKQVTNKTEGQSHVPPKQITCLEAESDVLAGTLSNIIRGLLDDRQFHAACQKVSDEPTPYFQQYSSKPSVSRAPSSVRPVTPTHSQEEPDVSPIESIASTSRSTEPSVRQFDVTSSVSLGTPASRPVAISVENMAGEDEVSQEEPFENEDRSFSSADPQCRTSSSATLPQHRKTKKDIETSYEKEKHFQHTQRLKKLPEFGCLMESLLENTVANVIHEAFYEEFNITARPRLVALPPKSRTPASISTTPRS